VASSVMTSVSFMCLTSLHQCVTTHGEKDPAGRYFFQ